MSDMECLLLILAFFGWKGGSGCFADMNYLFQVWERQCLKLKFGKNMKRWRRVVKLCSMKIGSLLRWWTSGSSDKFWFTISWIRSKWDGYDWDGLLHNISFAGLFGEPSFFFFCLSSCLFLSFWSLGLREGIAEHGFVRYLGIYFSFRWNVLFFFKLLLGKKVMFNILNKG